MKRIYHLSLIALAALGLFLLMAAPSALAQSPYELSAQVDANDITTDDTVTYTLSLVTPDGNAPNLKLPALDGFDVVSSQMGTQYSVVNGTSSLRTIYSYVLQPTRVGDLRIPKLNLTLGGQALHTEPLTVHVTQGNGQPSRKPATSPFGGAFGNAFGAGGSPFGSVFGSNPFNDPFFNDPFGSSPFSNNANLNIQAAADKESVYVGEPLQYTVRVQSDAMLLGEPEYDQPKFTGFWAHEPAATERTMDGTDITTLLYPTQAGKLTIDPATIRADGGFFSNPLERQTQPITVDVKPLPPGAPADFGGAVGKFELSAEPDKTATRVGEPVTVKVTIQGAGNFDTLPDPKWDNGADWRAFDAKGETQSSVVNGNLQGTRTYERTLIPTAEGILTIPGTRYAYFDPADAQYHVAETAPIKIQVAPGDPAVVGNLNNGSGSSSQNNAPTAPTNDAQSETASALKPAGALLTSAAPPLTAQPLFLGLFVLPFAVVGADLAWAWRKNYLAANRAERRASRALKQALDQLKRAPSSANVPAAVAAATKGYVEDKLNRSVNGMSHSAVQELLEENGVSAETAKRAVELLYAGESAEFGQLYPAASQQLVDDAGVVLNQIEKEWVA